MRTKKKGKGEVRAELKIRRVLPWGGQEPEGRVNEEPGEKKREEGEKSMPDPKPLYGKLARRAALGIVPLEEADQEPFDTREGLKGGGGLGVKDVVAGLPDCKIEDNGTPVAI